MEIWDIFNNVSEQQSHKTLWIYPLHFTISTDPLPSSNAPFTTSTLFLLSNICNPYPHIYNDSTNYVISKYQGLVHFEGSLSLFDDSLHSLLVYSRTSREQAKDKLRGLNIPRHRQSKTTMMGLWVFETTRPLWIASRLFITKNIFFILRQIRITNMDKNHCINCFWTKQTLNHSRIPIWPIKRLHRFRESICIYGHCWSKHSSMHLGFVSCLQDFIHSYYIYIFHNSKI